MNAACMNLWIVSSLPPPVHGVATFNRLLIADLQRRAIEYRFYRVGESGTPESIGRWSIRKMVADLSTVAKVVADALRQPRRDRHRFVLYFTPSQGGLAALRDFILTHLARRLSMRVVAHLHGCGWLVVIRDNPLIGWFMRRSLLQCDTVICLGETFAKRMADAVGIHCVGINNGYSRGMHSTSRSGPSPEAAIELLYLGALLEAKGLWEAARATCIMRDAGRSVRLTCAGSWQSHIERAEFYKTFRDEMDRGTIEFFGHADEPAKQQLFERTHFLLLPTRYRFEGQPLVLIEALSFGVVPVTTDHAGIPDLMRFRDSARLVRPEHAGADGLGATILGIASDASAYERLSKGCLDHYNSELRIEHCVDRILSVLALRGAMALGSHSPSASL